MVPAGHERLDIGGDPAVRVDDARRAMVLEPGDVGEPVLGGPGEPQRHLILVRREDVDPEPGSLGEPGEQP